MDTRYVLQVACTRYMQLATPGQLGSGPGQSMAEIIDNIDYESFKESIIQILHSAVILYWQQNFSCARCAENNRAGKNS